MDKHMTGKTETAGARAYKRIAPKSIEVALLPFQIAKAFCGKMWTPVSSTYPNCCYFDMSTDWPCPVANNRTIPIQLEKLYLLGDTKNRQGLQVFATANPARYPLALGIVQQGRLFKHMASSVKTDLQAALVSILKRFLTPTSRTTSIPEEAYFCSTLVPAAAYGDGHVLATCIAMLLAVL